MVAAGLVLIAVCAIGRRVVQVHSETGEWRVAPSAAPPALNVRGHDYARSGLASEPPMGTLDVDVLGRTKGGGRVSSPDGE